MGRKRQPAPTNIIQLDFFELTDHVALKTKPYYVEQHDDHWPPYAEITSTRVIARQPRPLTRRAEKKPEPFLSDKFPQHRWQKYCSGGHWVDRWRFGEDSRNHDGLQSWCYECEAKRLRRYRALQKYEQKEAA